MFFQVNGDRSAMENIADSTAIKIAFQAYRKSLRNQGFSSIEDDEEFFASFANVSIVSIHALFYFPKTLPISH